MMTRFFRPFAAALLLVALGIVPASAEPPVRVVSVGGAVTEIVYALGMQDRLVAVDATSIYPPAAEDLPDVGYMRQLAAEPILALDPDLVLMIEDSGPPETLAQLEAAGLPIAPIPDTPTIAGVRDKIRRVADALDRPEEGAALAAEVERAYTAVVDRLEGVTHRPRVLFLMAMGGGAPMAAGADTPAAAVIAMAGGQPAVPEMTGFKPLSPEAAAAAAPDVILVPDRTVEALGGAEAILARPELAATPAGRTGRLVSMDIMLLLGFGPRLPEAVADLATELHPDRMAAR
ncbi:ABC transporter substrate-binding protein [Roseospira marina]|uniref:ABC transporter substrate-binding protein n=1 Tax=Roseospira marina TaxID=140057 RepID=A0A5M6IFA5_9PROT|nr:ABC transporter substrate-binding protein [Roseospira marina]KAA5606429.1 ABC transporter substrate-binding protein [Roseospira marina]MBB4314157.1 iron complex transport system substrate-binding protein [Roseospira marina]MBB5087318.1 iron complex transport system substrate-binding protein [Roseospira marina]